MVMCGCVGVCVGADNWSSQSSSQAERSALSGASNNVAAFHVTSIPKSESETQNDFQEKIHSTQRVGIFFFLSLNSFSTVFPSESRALLDGKTKTEKPKATLYATSGGKFVSV